MTIRGRILVVDDDPDIFDRVSQLVEEDHEVVEVTSWEDLQREYAEVGCDLVLMDVNLPILRGDRLVELLRGAGDRAPVVYFSSEEEGHLARLARETGAAGYLSKSLRNQELLARIEGFLQGGADGPRSSSS